MGKKKIRKKLREYKEWMLFKGLQSDEFSMYMSPISAESVMAGFQKEGNTIADIADRLPELSEEQKRNVQTFLTEINKRLGWDGAIPIAVKYLVHTLKITEQEARLVYRIVSARILTDGF